jgi:hypothetical protein
MDPIVVAFGLALVGAMATDSWQQAKDAVTGLWHRVRPQQADGIGTELDTLREEILHSRSLGGADAEHAMQGTWQAKLQQLLRDDPALACELERILDQVLTPALTTGEQTRIATIITGTAGGNAHLNQTGGGLEVTAGDRYTAGRDLTIHRP